MARVLAARRPSLRASLRLLSRTALRRASRLPLHLSKRALSAAILVVALACERPDPLPTPTEPQQPPAKGTPGPKPPAPPPPAPPPPPPNGSDVKFAINVANQHPVSRYIYGINFLTDAIGKNANLSPWYGASPPVEATLNRFGGNRLSAYNWENNYSNAGRDYHYQNDNYLSPSTVPGAAVQSRATATFSRGAGIIVTVPMIGYVAGDNQGVQLDTLDSDRAARLAAHFKVSVPAKGAPFDLTPDATDSIVYQDEFVNWVEQTFPGSMTDPIRPIFFSLDNEPDLWASSHREIESNYNDNPQTPRIHTYDNFIDTTILYAAAIKSVAPQAVVFGPVAATYTGVATLGRWPNPDPVYGKQNFTAVYLSRLRQAEATYGQRLVDVLDIHWYPASGTRQGSILNDYATQDSAMVTARLQAPRSLWDPTYNEESWVSNTAGGPVKLLPRLQSLISANYPGTKIAITEYFYGRGGDITGGIAEADVLGIFGREGVFAATMWPQAGIWAKPYSGSGAKAYAYAFGAFRSFLNYDGAGSRFGDTGLSATTTDNLNTSVYASLDAQGRLVLVAINKRAKALRTAITITGGPTLHTAHAYAIIDGTPNPARQATDPVVSAGNVVSYTMPPMSVTTIVVSP